MDYAGTFAQGFTRFANDGTEHTAAIFFSFGNRLGKQDAFPFEAEIVMQVARLDACE